MQNVVNLTSQQTRTAVKGYNFGYPGTQPTVGLRWPGPVFKQGPKTTFLSTRHYKLLKMKRPDLLGKNENVQTKNNHSCCSMILTALREANH